MKRSYLTVIINQYQIVVSEPVCLWSAEANQCIQKMWNNSWWNISAYRSITVMHFPVEIPFFPLFVSLTTSQLSCPISITESRLHHFSRLHRAFFLSTFLFALRFHLKSDIGYYQGKKTVYWFVFSSERPVFSRVGICCLSKHFELKAMSLSVTNPYRAKSQNKQTKGLSTCIIHGAHKNIPPLLNCSSPKESAEGPEWDSRDVKKHGAAPSSCQLFISDFLESLL